MAINLCCTNSNCKYYYEQMCSKNVHEEFMVISESGQCVTFEEGVSDWYERADANSIRLSQLEDIFKRNGYTEQLINEIKSLDGATEIEEFISNLDEERSCWGC